MAFWSRQKQNSVASDHGSDVDPELVTSILGAPIVFIDRKELYESGFEFCREGIVDACSSVGLSILLDDVRDPPTGVLISDQDIVRWLWVGDVFLMEDYGVDVEFRLADGRLGQSRALDWDFVHALRDICQDAVTSGRNWHLGDIDEGYLLILARPEELPAIAAHRTFPGFGVADLTDAVEVRRGDDL